MVVTDYEGKVVVWEGTRQEALDKGLNVDCINCSRCSRCSRCSDCFRCEAQPVQITTELWNICIRQNGSMKIGCQDHPLIEWMGFDDERISSMHYLALTFWRKWKPVIEQIIKK